MLVKASSWLPRRRRASTAKRRSSRTSSRPRSRRTSTPARSSSSTSCRAPRPASCSASGCASTTDVSRSHPRHLILSLYGLYARDEHDWLSVRSLVALMDDLGVDAAAVRSSVSRLKRRGVLEPSRDDGQAGYALSADALDDAARGRRAHLVAAPGTARRRLAGGRLLGPGGRAREAARPALAADPARLRHRRARRLGRPRHGVRRDARGARAAGPRDVHRVLPRRLPRGGRRGRRGCASGGTSTRSTALYDDFLADASAARPPAGGPTPRRAFAAYVPMLTAGAGCPTSTPACRSTPPADWPGVGPPDLFDDPRRRRLREPATRVLSIATPPGAQRLGRLR